VSEKVEAAVEWRVFCVSKMTSWVEAGSLLWPDSPESGWPGFGSPATSWICRRSNEGKPIFDLVTRPLYGRALGEPGTGLWRVRPQ